MPLCKKRSYPSRQSADRAADRLKRKHGADGHDTYAYLCLECERWHLSSLPLWKFLNSDENRRIVAERLAREILGDYRKRLDAIGREIKAEQRLQSFREECDRLQAKVRQLLGVTP